LSYLILTSTLVSPVNSWFCSFVGISYLSTLVISISITSNTSFYILLLPASGETYKMADRWAQEFNGGDDDDEALQLAIDMSLGKEPRAKARAKDRPVLVDLTQDDIETASEASGHGTAVDETVKPVLSPDMGESAHKAESAVKEDVSGDEGRQQSSPKSPPAPVSSLSLLGLDRAKMEEERLARIRKRKASQDGHSHEGDAKRMRTNEEKLPLVAAGKRVVKDGDQGMAVRSGLMGPSAQMSGSLTSDRNAEDRSQEQNVNIRKEHSNLPFPRGVVKKTWARGQPRLGDDIKLEEVLQKDQLEMALISSFQWDQEWMMDRFDMRRTKLLLVSTGGDEAEVRAGGVLVICHLFCVIPSLVSYTLLDPDRRPAYATFGSAAFFWGPV
jgi:hypothetical protein